jgi:hypothetical protein
VSKLKFLLPAAVVIGMFFVSCKKTTTNTTVVKDSIYYSPWIELSMTQDVPTAGDTVYYQDITASQVTSSIVSTGAVLGYFGYPASASDTVIYSEAGMAGIAYLTTIPGTIEVDANYDLSYFRYVVIPGNVLVTSFNGVTQQQLQKMSFTDVQKALNASKQASGNTFNP